ncbi:MAG: DUF3291 domain-containing protein [Hyphomicrobiales bacterium]
MPYYLAIYNFGIFAKPSEHSANDDWHAREGPIFDKLTKAPGFIDRSGYDGEPGPNSWGTQVLPRFYEERGDGWAPATLSMWESLEALFNFTYTGLHKEAFARGKQWMVRGDWPPYVLWWVHHNHQPNWAEGVERFEHLHDHGPTAHAFNFKRAFRVDGEPLQSVTRT